MTRELFRLAAGVILALLLAGGAAAADANTTLAANQTTPAAWEHTYGGLGNETMVSLIEPSGGGYLLVGSTTANGSGGELYLVRTDANGTSIREERVPFGAGGPGSPAMASLTPENGVVVVGRTGAASPGGEDVLLLRLAPDGRQRWSRSYAVGSGRDSGEAVVPATDGGYLVAGTTDLTSGGAPALLLLKTGEDGGEIWHRSLSLGGSILVVHDLLATPDGGYLVIGSTDAARPGFLDILLVKVSSGGNREWQRTYAFGTETADGYALESSPDGGWLLLGDVNGTGSPPHAVVLLKVDTTGYEQWRKRLSAGAARTWGYALSSAGAGGYAVAGAVEAPEGTRSYVARLDRSGAEAWNRTFAIGNGPSEGLGVMAGTQDRLVIGGEASRTTDALYDLYLTSIVPPVAAPNATPAATVNGTVTATPNATPTANVSSITTTAVPATTQAALAPPVCLIAVVGLALIVALLRR